MVSLGAIDTSNRSSIATSNIISNSSISNHNNSSNSNSSVSHISNQPAGLFTNGTKKSDPSVFAVWGGVQVEEIIIVAIIVVFWILAVMAFRRKWDSIRIMQPMEPRYKHIPKNLDSVKVVKRPQDSIIYKSYSRKMSVTMVAREKRHLQRTLTMPCMNALPSFQAISSPARTSAKPTLPTIHMEEVTTEM